MSNYTYNSRSKAIKTAREMLDRDYHVLNAYSESRKDLHNDIVDTLLGRGCCGDVQCLIQPQKPKVHWIIFMSGPMGSGKTFISEWMLKNGHLPLHSPVTIDMDRVRFMLPEMRTLSALNPQAACQKTQKESGLIAELALHVVRK